MEFAICYNNKGTIVNTEFKRLTPETTMMCRHQFPENRMIFCQLKQDYLDALNLFREMGYRDTKF